MSDSSIIRIIASSKWVLAVSLIVWLIVGGMFLSMRKDVFEASILLQTVTKDSKEADVILRTSAEKMKRLSAFQDVLGRHADSFASHQIFRAATAIRVLPRTRLLEISVRHSNGETAAKLAGALLERFNSKEAEIGGGDSSQSKQIAILEAHRADLLKRYQDKENPVVKKTDAELEQLRNELNQKPIELPLEVADPIYINGPVNPSPVVVLLAALACGIVTGGILAWIRSA